MSYVLERISLYENDEIKETNLVIKDCAFYSRDTSVAYIRFMRLQMDKHIIVAGETVIGELAEYIYKGLDYAMELVLLGATTVLFPVDVAYEYQVEQALEEARKILKAFPLDYVLLLRVPVKAVTPTMVRCCKQNHIPGLIIRIDSEAALQEMPINWIREAAFPYKLVFIPQFSSDQEKEAAIWESVFTDSGIVHCRKSVPIHRHLPKKILKMIGVYPYKGILRTGGEVTYNVIQDQHSRSLLNHEVYHDKIVCTVFKNTVIRAGAEITLPAGLGQELVIKVPGFFQ